MKKNVLILLILGALLCACSRGPVPETTASRPETTVSAPTAQTTVPPAAETTAPATEAPEVYQFPEGVEVYGVSLAGMTEQEALEAVRSGAEKYVLTVSAGKKQARLSASDLGIRFSEQGFLDYCGRMKAGTGVEETGIVEFDLEAICEKLKPMLETSPSNAYFYYSSYHDQFVPADSSKGTAVDWDGARPVLARAAEFGFAEADLTEFCSERRPGINADSEMIQTAVENANRYLDIQLTYRYEPENGKASERTVTRGELASFISADSDYQVYVSLSAVKSYAEKMADRYSESGKTGNFKTTGGGTVGLSVSYYGQRVNVDALAKDIHACVSSGISGTRTAPYNKTDLAYGGNYVEVSLTDQYMWVYNNGTCVASTPIVSGCVAEGKHTPTGVFTIYDLDRDCWLTGPTWNDFVSYWIGFYGSYGIHDASWRDQFGEDIYIYEGSHGCANMPVSQAAGIYNHTYLGMKVIIYGGKNKAEPLQQEIRLQNQYRLPADAKAFALDAKLKYPGAPVSYQSDHPEVVSVSKDGKITVKGIGSATVTVQAGKFTYHTQASEKISFTIYSPCEDGRHQFGGWIQTKAPSCVPGEDTRTCAGCGQTEKRELQPVAEHAFGNWITDTEPGCETPGSQSCICETCQQKFHREIPALGHDFHEGEEFCRHGCGTRNPDCLPPDTNPETSVPESSEPDSTDETESHTSEPENQPDTTDPVNLS